MMCKYRFTQYFIFYILLLNYIQGKAHFYSYFRVTQYRYDDNLACQCKGKPHRKIFIIDDDICDVLIEPLSDITESEVKKRYFIGKE